MSTSSSSKAKAPAKASPRRASPRRRGRPSGSFSAWGKILQGAGEAYARKGYASTTVEDILRAAGVSRRTFYKSFRSKDDVFEALYEFSTALFLKTIRQAAASVRAPEKKLERCVEAFLEFPITAGPIYRVFFIEAHEPGSRLAERRQAILADLIDLLDGEVFAARGKRVDRWVFLGLLAALENVALHVLTETAATRADLARAKAVMLRILDATLAEGDEVPPPLPLEPAPA